MKHMTMSQYMEIKSLIQYNTKRLTELDNQLTAVRHTLAYLTEDEFDETSDLLKKIKAEIDAINRNTDQLRKSIKGYLAPAVA